MNKHVFFLQARNISPGTKWSLYVKRCLKLAQPAVTEYGCGIGRNISFLQKAFPNAVIVDTFISSAASLELARCAHAEVEFVQESDYADSIDRFDVIFVAGVFHHVPVEQRVNVARVTCLSVCRRAACDSSLSTIRLTQLPDV